MYVRAGGLHRSVEATRFCSAPVPVPVQYINLLCVKTASAPTRAMQATFLVLLVCFLGYSGATLLYNPSFNGGTGCTASGVIDSSCSSTPNSARQATNGAGGAELFFLAHGQGRHFYITNTFFEYRFAKFNHLNFVYLQFYAIMGPRLAIRTAHRKIATQTLLPVQLAMLVASYRTCGSARVTTHSSQLLRFRKPCPTELASIAS